MNALGIDGVAARIAEIQARIAALQPPPTASGAFPVRPADVGGGAPAAGAVPGPSTPSLLRAAAARVPAPDAAWVARLPEAGRRWAGEIAAAAEHAGIDPRLLAALVGTESGFRPDARSHAGAVGLGQLMPGTARGLGVDPHDPADNLRGAARYLREQLDRFGQVDLALAAYNAGPGRVARAGRVPDIPETQTYVRRVMSSYAQLTGA